MNDQLSGQQIDQVSHLLSQFDPGFLPYPIFIEIARLCALPIVEIVPFRRNGAAIDILLLDRGADDPLFANQLHTPGTVVRATDTEQSAIDRILHVELGGVPTTSPVFVTYVLHKSKRGAESARVFWVEVQEEPRKGKFYASDNLPDTLMRSQLDFIQAALESYEQKQIIPSVEK